MLAIAAAVGAGGCGGVGVSTAGTVSGNHLTIYSSLPLEGAMAPVSRQIVGGEKLALAQAGRARAPLQALLRLAQRREPQDR